MYTLNRLNRLLTVQIHERKENPFKKKEKKKPPPSCPMLIVKAMNDIEVNKDTPRTACGNGGRRDGIYPSLASHIVSARELLTCF